MISFPTPRTGARAWRTERRPFKSPISISGTGVWKDRPTIQNPGHTETRSTRREFKSLIVINDDNADEPELCTTRYVDVDGTELWHRDHGATVTGVAIDDSGNTYEVGEEDPSGYTLRKRDSSGTLLWSRKHGANLNCCALCPDGIAVAGLAGTGGATMRKYLADGTLSWSLALTNTLAATVAPIIEIAADSAGNIAAIDGPTDLWARGVYAISSSGTLVSLIYFGTHFPGTDTDDTWPSGIAFSGVPVANAGVFSDAFSFYINGDTFRPDLGAVVNQNTGYVWSDSRGYYTNIFGDHSGDIPIQDLNGIVLLPTPHILTPAEFPPGFGHVYRSTFRGMTFGNFVRAIVGDFTYVNTSSPDDYSDIVGLGLALCSRPGYIWTADNVLERYSLVSPRPTSYPAREWNEVPDWQVSHWGLVHDCQANASNVSILGGVRATVLSPTP